MATITEMAGDAHATQVILVDSDDELRETIKEYLADYGFLVRGVADGRGLDLALAERPADLLLVDVRLPGEDGLSVVNRIRARSEVPIILMTGATDVVDRVVGLELGADDFMTKPFDIREMKARMRAILRRRSLDTLKDAVSGKSAKGKAPMEAISQKSEFRKIPFGRAYLDLDGYCLVHADGERETLTAMEFDLLKVLAHNPNRVLSRDRLLDLAHGRDNEPFDRSIDVRITRLRKKVEADPARPSTIKTVRGVGYMFVSNAPA